MGKLLPIASLVVIAGLCTAVAIETQSLFRLKAEIARLREQIAGTQHATRAAQQEAASLREKTDTFRAESEELRKQIGGVPAGAVASEEGAKSGQEGFMKNLSKMFSDPDMKKAMRGQQAMAARMMYGDFIKQAKLAPPDADKLMDLLADRQMDAAGKGMELMAGQSAGKAEAASKEIQDSHAAYDEQLKNLLGESGFKQLEDYDKSLGDRMMLQQYQAQFAASGQPLEDSQRDGLLKIMAEERAKVPATAFDPGNTDPAAQFKALQSDQAMHDLLAHQTEINERVLARAGSVLSADQVAAFQKIQSQMAQMQEAGIKMSRSMFQ